MVRFALDDNDTDTEDETSSSPLSPHEQQTPEKHHDLDVDPWLNDEDALGNDENVVSDIEMENDYVTEAVFKETEAAFLQLSKQAKLMSVESPPEAFEEEEMEEMFEGEGEEPAVDYDDVGSRRVKVSSEDYLWASSGHGSSGICSRLASKAFAGERRVPSSTDCFKMGHSFGVSFGRDGSFAFVKNGPGSFVRRRPAFNNEQGSSMMDISTKYLKTHQQFSSKIATTVDDRSPRFCLPMAISAGGNVASHAALHEVLESYVKQASTSGSNIGELSFALLACLKDTEESVQACEANFGPKRDLLFNSRRNEGLVRFLKDAVKPAVDKEVQWALSNNDIHGAVFALLSGGDLARACQVAAQGGQEDLAACLSTFDVVGKEEILEQVQLAASGSVQVPEKLMRIYKLCAGDLKDEENRFRSGSSRMGWMRHLILRLMYSTPEKVACDISDILASYDSDVKAGIVPFPKPLYESAEDGVECVLYRLLRLALSSQRISCLEVLDPRGISASNHDFSLTFHMACILSAMGICPTLEEEERLLSGYVSQLLSGGCWEWAVYVCLCSLNPDMLDSSDWKREKAKEIVLQNFHQGSPAEIRQFLENVVGTPKEWLSEAMANRSVSGDPFEYIGHLASFSPSKAAEVLNEVIVPNLLFMSTPNLERSRALLDSFSEVSPLSTALLNLIDLSEDVKYLASAPHQEVSERLPMMLEVCKDIEKTLRAHRSENTKTRDALATKFFSPRVDVIPVPAMLSEALEQLSVVQLKLQAIEKGIPIDSVGKAQLSFLTSLPGDIRGLR